MTIGIYALYWEVPDSIYIGQSTTIENRYKEHISHLRNNKHYNKKVQQTYNKHGKPVLEILTLSEVSQLNNLEILYISEFPGCLNSSKGGDVFTAGETHPGALYSNTKIAEAFHILCLRKHSHKDIEKITGVSISVIHAISSGQAHGWLQEQFPLEYSKLLSSITHTQFGENNPNAENSNEDIINLFHLLVERKTSLREISKVSGISYNTVMAVATGNNHIWLKEMFPEEHSKMLLNKGKILKKYPPITNGTIIVDNIINISEFCRGRGLNPGNLTSVFSGKRKSCGGWALCK